MKFMNSDVLLIQFRYNFRLVKNSDQNRRKIIKLTTQYPLKIPPILPNSKISRKTASHLHENFHSSSTIKHLLTPFEVSHPFEVAHFRWTAASNNRSPSPGRNQSVLQTWNRWKKKKFSWWSSITTCYSSKPEVYRARRERGERGPSRFVEWVRVTGSCCLGHGPATIPFPPFRAASKEEESRLLRVWPFFVDRLRYYLATKNEGPRAGSKLSNLLCVESCDTSDVARELNESSRFLRSLDEWDVTRVVTGLLEGDRPFNLWWVMARIAVIYRTWIYLYLLVGFIYIYVCISCDGFIDTYGDVEGSTLCWNKRESFIYMCI